MTIRFRQALILPTVAILLLVIIFLAVPSSVESSPNAPPAKSGITGDGAITPRQFPQRGQHQPSIRNDSGNLPVRDDPDEFFTFRYLVSENGGEDWSEILGAGDPGMWTRDENGEPISNWPAAAYDFGVVATSNNDLHFIAVLNGFSDEEDLNPEGRVNGVYDVRVDADGNSSYNLIAPQPDGQQMTWSDGGIDADGNLYALWVNIANGRAEFRASRSENGGDDWSESTQILANLNIGDAGAASMPYPHMTYHVGEYFYVIYQHENDGMWEHRILRVPSSLEGNVAQQDPGAVSGTYVSYYVSSINPIDQDPEAGWVYFVVRNEDMSGCRIGWTDDDGANWRTTVLGGAQRYPSIALDPVNQVPWVFSNAGPSNPHRDWYSFDRQGYGGGAWIARHENDQVNYDGIRDLLYCHQGVFTSEGRLVTGSNIWGQFTPEGFLTNYSDSPYNHEWAGSQRLWSIFDEESLIGGFIPQNTIVAGGDNNIFVAFAGQYGEADFEGPIIENIRLSDYHLNGDWIVSADIHDRNGIYYTDVDFTIEGQENWDFRESDRSEVDGNGNGRYYFTIPSDAILDDELEAGTRVTFFIYAADMLWNESLSDNCTIIVDEGWEPGNPDEEPELQHFTEFAETETSNTIQIEVVSLDGNDVPTGWEVGVFTPAGLLSGAGVWQRGELLTFNAWGDIEETDFTEGFVDGEEMSFMLWDNRADEEFESDIELINGSLEWHDGAQTDLNLSVIAVNHPPVWTEVPGAIVVSEAQRILVNIVAIDEDGDNLDLTAVENTLPEGSLFFDRGGGEGTFNWQTDFVSSGEYYPIFVVTDGELTDTAVIHITVNNINRPPFLNHIGSEEPPDGSPLPDGDQVRFVWNSATDPDGEELIYVLYMRGYRDHFYFNAGNDSSRMVSRANILSLMGENGIPVTWWYSVTDGIDTTYADTAFTLLPPLNVEEGVLAPEGFSLSDPYPNPFNSSVTITFSTGSAARPTRLAVYDLSGRMLADLLSSETLNLRANGGGSAVGYGDPRVGRVVWDASGMAAGIYFVKLETPSQRAMRKIVLVR